MADPTPEPEVSAEGRAPLAPVPLSQIENASADEAPSPWLGVNAIRFPAWTWWDAIVVFGITVAAIFLCSLGALVLAQVIPSYRHLSVSTLAGDTYLVVGSQIAAYPLVILAMALLVHGRTSEPFLIAIRWNWPHKAAAAFFLLGLILAFSIEGMARFLPIPKSLPMDKLFRDAPSAYLVAFFAITLAPLLEELFFRGLVYPLLRRAVSIIPAVLLTAAAFAGIHGAQLGYAWAPILSIFVVGIVLTLVRERTNSVAASFLTHCGYNCTLFGLLWLASDHFQHLEKLTN